MVDDLTEYERPILHSSKLAGSLATDDSGIDRILNPLTGAGLFTSNMNPLVSGTDPLTGLAALAGTDILFSAPVRRYLSSKVVNGAFEEPPPDINSPIGEDNPLPGWKWVNESGSGFVAKWVLTGGGLNGQVNVTMVSGAAGDRSYLEQLVPVNPSSAYIWYYRLLPWVTGDSSVDAYVTTQFLDSTGATTGTAATDTGDSSANSPLYPDTDGSAPGAAAWLRVRVGWQRNSGAATTATGTGILLEVAVNEGNNWGVYDLVSGQNWTPTLTFATPGDLAVVYSTQKGSYNKVNKMVYWWATVITSTWTWTTSAGGLLISGLPYTAATSAGAVWLGSAVLRYTKANYTHVMSMVQSAENFVRFPATGSGQAVTNVVAADVPSATQITLYASGVYEATT